MNSALDNDRQREETFRTVLQKADEVIRSAEDRNKKLHRICRLLADHFEHYDWVGFYLVDPQKERELVLGPYVGDPTIHVRIEFGEGICGQAAEREETFVIQDVSKEDNYLSCSVNVKSEIVVPILKEGKVVGEIDIDSHQLAPFTKHDRVYLEKLAEMLSVLF